MDCGYARWEAEEISVCDDMPTSIIRVHTPEGFVVGADGREYDSKTGLPINDNLRKVFTISQRRRRLIYAFSGTNKLMRIAPPHAEEDILNIVHTVVEGLAQSLRGNLESYANGIGKALQKLPDREKDKSTLIYLDGYYNRHAERATLEIFHDGKSDPKAYPERLSVGEFKALGSANIYAALVGETDERIAKYRSPSWKIKKAERTLADAIELAKNYIGAHCDDEVREGIDPEKYHTIGGVGHLCVVRPNGEFDWMYRSVQTGEWIACDPPTHSTIP
jgi:hypothetical protein